jgi:ribosomal protein S17
MKHTRIRIRIQAIFYKSLSISKLFFVVETRPLSKNSRFTKRDFTLKNVDAESKSA